VAAADVAASRLPEAEALAWREGVSERTLRRDGRRWTVWTASVVFLFVMPGVVLVWIEPLTFPAALVCFAHAYAVPRIQAARGARSPRPIGSERSAAGSIGAERAEGVALGLLADLVGHEARELLGRTGLALQSGRLGAWLVGEEGAILVRPAGRRAFCWCVRIAEPEGLPAGDRVAHLLLALREDEEGFATVANLQFSGAVWRVRRRLGGRVREALDAARAVSGGT
jgi:hypothetical protein